MTDVLATDDAIELARQLLGGRTANFGWGGRVRVVLRDLGPTSRWKGARTAPSYRHVTRAFRDARAMQFALSPSEARSATATLSNWLPACCDGLTPMSAIIGTPGRARTIVVRMVDVRGKPVVAVKIGVSPLASSRIQRETAALKDVTVRDRAPKLLWSGEVDGRATIATEYVVGRPGVATSRGAGQARAVLPNVSEQATTIAWDRHPWIVKTLQESALSYDVAEGLKGIWPVVRIHGDLAPWNLIERPGGRSVVAIDWEDSDEHGFPGVDMAHHALSGMMKIRRAGPSTAALEAIGRLRSILGFSEEAARAVVVLTAAAARAKELVDGDDSQDVERWRRVVEVCRP